MKSKPPLLIWLTGRQPKKQEDVDRMHIIMPETFWVVSFLGDFYGLTVRVQNAPNVFHRIAQRIILGFKYRYEDKRLDK
jgi:hypothetical protein